MVLMPLDRGKFVVVHPPVFNLLRLPPTPTVDITKWRSPKNGNNLGFWLPEGDRINLIGNRESVQEPPNVKICPKLWFLATGSRHNKHIHMKFGV